MARITPDPGMVTSTVPDTGVAAVTPTASANRSTTRPSMWSAVWALLALIYLASARRFFAKLG